MTRTLWPHQKKGLDETIESLTENPILVMPTGGGKTFTASELVLRLDKPTLWLAHRRELIEQAAGQLYALGLNVLTIQAGPPTPYNPTPESFFAEQDGPPVYVASVDTLRTRRPPKVKLIVSDECHHDMARGRKSILDAFSDIPHVGLTATPFRLDGRGLGDAGYRRIIVAAYADELVAAGILHAPKVYCGTAPDLRGVGKVGSDFNLGRLAERLNTSVMNLSIVENWQKKAAGRRTVCFATNIEHSQHIVQSFLDAGIPAEHLDGGTPETDRDGILKRLKSGKTLIVSNCMVWTEGFDLPALECAIIARSTMSLNLHWQTIGRIMRSCEGKDGAIVLDHAGNHDRHGLVTRRIEYSLEGKIVAEDDPLGLRRCGGCYFLYPPSMPECPECGWRPFVEEREEREGGGKPGQYGDLVEFIEDFDYRAQWWRNIEAQREMMCFKPGWSSFRYKERFGVWPDVMDGELINSREATLDQKRRIYQNFEVTADERGFKPGWAAVRYKDIFGEWPSTIVKMPPITCAVVIPPPPIAARACAGIDYPESWDEIIEDTYMPTMEEKPVRIIIPPPPPPRRAAA